MNSWLHKRPLRYLGLGVADTRFGIVYMRLTSFHRSIGISGPTIALFPRVVNVGSGAQSACSLAQVSAWCPSRLGDTQVEAAADGYPSGQFATGVGLESWPTQIQALSRTQLHVILDNSSTHSTPAMDAWLAAHPRVQFHFTPTGASWLNLVEVWFSLLTRKSVRRGAFDTVKGSSRTSVGISRPGTTTPHRLSGPRSRPASFGKSSGGSIHMTFETRY